MPHFRGVDAVDVDALFAHLRSLPAKVQPLGHRALSSVNPETAASDPARQFAALGCINCHGPGARYEEKLNGASTKHVTELARWIRNPEQFVPGTSMPTFAAVLDQAAAERLAAWLKQGGRAPRSGS
jgi:mono/diheme cytochrome c family protein